MPTIQSALVEAVNTLTYMTESPMLDAEILLCKVLAKDRAYLRACPEQEISDRQSQEFTAFIAKRQQGQPIAYLIGKREFWSREFIVSPDVLIPRPETETLVEVVLGLVPKDQSLKIIDLGTGSGIIAITLAAELPKAQVYATDISAEALKIAKINAAKHKVVHIKFYQSNWLDNVPYSKFDLIVSNPPYVAEGDEHLKQGDLRFEPIAALVSAGQGLSDLETIAKTAVDRLNDNGYLLVEHGYNQQEAMQKIFLELGYHDVKTHQDLSGQPRVTAGRYLSTS